MPAITLGVAEVEAHLQGLQKRLNAFVALRVACVTLTAAFGVAAVTVALGWHQRLAARGLLLWTLLAWVVVLGALSVWEVRRRWISLQTATELVDHTARLSDRLTTLLGLRERPRTSELAPLLVAQVIAALPRCQPQLVVPFRLPGSAYGLAISLMALILAVRLAPEQPPPAGGASPAQMKQSDASVVHAPQDTAASTQQRGRDGTGSESEKGAGSNNSGKDGGEQEDDSSDSSGAAAKDSSSASQSPGVTDRLFALLPDDVHRALVGPSKDSKGGSQQHPGEQRKPDIKPGDDTSTAQKAPPGDTAEAKAGQNGDHGNSDEGREGTDGKPHAQSPNSDNQSQSSARKSDTSDAKQSALKPSHDEKAPPSGSGSSPDNLMDTAAASAALEADAEPKTFKLTITSFLQAAQPREKKAKRGAKRVAGGEAAVESSTPTTPSDQQLRDDILHKAEIPPEYEDLVRRVYSARTVPDEP